jgi:hypothetical protein
LDHQVLAITPCLSRTRAPAREGNTVYKAPATIGERAPASEPMCVGFRIELLRDSTTRLSIELLRNTPPQLKLKEEFYHECRCIYGFMDQGSSSKGY